MQPPLTIIVELHVTPQHHLISHGLCNTRTKTAENFLRLRALDYCCEVVSEEGTNKKVSHAVTLST